jgi:hypothetical protein
LIIYTKVKINCIKLTLEHQREQSLRRTREEKGERTQNKHEKWRKKETIFFFNRLGGHEAGKKKKIGGHVVPTKKPQSRKMKKIKIKIAQYPQPPTWQRHC